MHTNFALGAPKLTRALRRLAVWLEGAGVNANVIEVLTPSLRPHTFSGSTVAIRVTGSVLGENTARLAGRMAVYV